MPDFPALQEHQATTGTPGSDITPKGSECSQPVSQGGLEQADPLKMGHREIELNMVRCTVVAEYRKFSASSGRGEVLKAKNEFVRIFNLGQFGPYQELFERLGKVSFKTLERWDSKLKATKDPFCLTDQRGKHRKGCCSVTEEQGRILIAIALSPNKPKLSEVVRMARARMQFKGMANPQSDKTFLNFLNSYKVNHLDTWTLFREGEKSLKEKCLPSLERDLDRIETGDILVADGHTLNFELMNPLTGKPKRMNLILFYDFKSNWPLGWEISTTENTEAIAVAMRRAILNLGKLPKIAYLDNGKAFRGRFFSAVTDFRQEAVSGVFERLGIHPIYAWPYNARSKTVERFWGTFSEFERRAFSFTGTSVKDKPPRLQRNEKLHRALHQHLTRGNVPTVEEAYRAISTWIETEYGNRPQRGHMDGRTPLDVFKEGRGPGFSAEQEASLRILMAAQQIRRIGRDGIKLPGSDVKYYHPDLYGRQMQSALIRYDWLDRSRVFVYGLDGSFLCVAEARKKVHPAAAYLGTDEERKELERQLIQQKALAKQTLGPARAVFDNSILPEVQRQQEELGLKGLPTTEPVKSIDLRSKQPIATDEPLSDARRAEIERGLAELEKLNENRQIPPWEQARSLSDFDRYEALLEIQAQGSELPASEKAWMSLFERGDAYRKHRIHFEQFQTKMVCMYGG